MVTLSGAPQDDYVDSCYHDHEEVGTLIQASRERNTAALAVMVRGIIAKLGLKEAVAPKDVPYHVFCGLLEAFKKSSFPFDLSAYPPRQNSYAKYIVYNHKNNGSHPFCFTLIVLAPGQKTPKHNHKVDCAPICVMGTIAETLYSEKPPEPGRRLGELQVLRKTLYQPCEGGFLRHEQPNVHHLENPTADLAMSLHLYVFDADPDEQGRIGSSVKHIYP